MTAVRSFQFLRVITKDNNFMSTSHSVRVQWWEKKIWKRCWWHGCLLFLFVRPVDCKKLELCSVVGRTVITVLRIVSLIWQCHRRMRRKWLFQCCCLDCCWRVAIHAKSIHSFLKHTSSCTQGCRGVEFTLTEMTYRGPLSHQSRNTHIVHAPA